MAAMLALPAISPFVEAQTASPAPLAIIVHETSPVSSLTLSELRKILLGETAEWSDGHRIVLVERDQTSRILRETLKVICKMTPAEYKRHMLAIEFQGGQAPMEKILNSDDAAAKFVRSVPGAIGVVENSSLASGGLRVKVLRVAGKLPGEAGYPLQ